MQIGLVGQVKRVGQIGQVGLVNASRALLKSKELPAALVAMLLASSVERTSKRADTLSQVSASGYLER